MNDQELDRIVQQAQQGSREALDKIAEWVIDADGYFLPYAYRLLKDYEEARDVIQESAVKICLKIKKYKPEESPFKNWCYRIVRNTALDARRRRRFGNASAQNFKNIQFTSNSTGESYTFFLQPRRYSSSEKERNQQRISMGRL